MESTADASEIVVSWKQLLGTLKQISFDGRTLAGCNDDDDIFIAREGVRSKPKWKKIEGKLKQVVVVGAALYGTNAADAIFFGRIDGRANNWTQLGGALRQISYDGSQVFGTTSLDATFSAHINLQSGTPNWYNSVGTPLHHVEIFCDKAYGVNSKEEVFFETGGTWTKLDGALLKQIAHDGTSLVGVDRAGTIFYANEDITTAPNWRPISPSTSPFKYVDVFDRELVAIDVYNKIWYTDLDNLPNVIYD